ncbi:hypothetical protein KR093_006323, partial [Drosophila rubida]
MFLVYRRIFLKKLFIATIALLFVLFIIRIQLPSEQKVKKMFTPCSLDRSRLQLEQNGDYWIYNGFMRSKTKLKGNMSITLTTHGTFRDLVHMKWLLVRWNAPISMAIYVDESDYEQLLDRLYYVKYCTVFSMSWPHWMSMQLVFHDKHLPLFLYRMDSQRPEGFNCQLRSNKENTNSTTTLPQKNSSTQANYPLNLLRNVARLNARTYYIIALEPGMLPTRNLALKFLRLVKWHQTSKPHRSVYCLPVFPPMGEDIILPKYKSDLIMQLQPFLNGSVKLSPMEAEQLNNFRPWLNHPVRDGDITVYQVTEKPQLCPVYISSNAYEPLYDQRCENSTWDQISMQLQVLVGLGFDFVVLDGSFIIRRQPVWQLDAPTDVAHRALSAVEVNHIREVIKLNSL